MDNNKIGLAGAALLVAGLFTPIFSTSLGGHINFIGGNSAFVSLSILALGGLGIYASARNELAKVSWAGFGSLAVLLSSFASAQYRFAQIQSEFEASIADNPFAQAARDAFRSPQIEWGWLVLAVGGGLLLYASLNERKLAEATVFKTSDQTDKNYGLAAGAAAVIGIGALVVGQLNARGEATGSAADARQAMSAAEDNARTVAAEAEANALEQEKRNYISENLEVYGLTARYMSSMLDGRVPGVTFKLKNNGERSLSGVEVTVEFLDAEKNAIAEEIYNPVIAGGYSSDPPLRPGYIWQNERGTFYAAKAVPSEWQSGNARAFVSDIEFAEGE